LVVDCDDEWFGRWRKQKRGNSSSLRGNEEIFRSIIKRKEMVKSKSTAHVGLEMLSKTILMEEICNPLNALPVIRAEPHVDGIFTRKLGKIFPIIFLNSTCTSGSQVWR
jgi:hypothetical protein